MGGYYVELIGIKGLNWLSKHFINREWIATCERFVECVDHWREEKGEFCVEKVGLYKKEDKLTL